MKRASEPRSRAVRVRRLERLPRRAFGRLVTRELGGGPALGGVSILHERLPAGTALPTVTHRRTTEWVFVTRGRMTAVLAGRRRRVSAGAVFVIRPGTPHRFATGRAACEALSVFHPALRPGPRADIVTGS